jgi:hypothetical protein
LTLIPAKITQDPLTQHQGESFGPNRKAWRISLGCSDSISSPRTGVEAILTELGPETQNWRYAVSSHAISGPMKKACQHGGDFDCATINGFLAAPPFVFAKKLLAREHAVVTSSNGIKAVLKLAADPESQPGAFQQPWMEVYATGLAKVFGMRNVPCARSSRFYLDEIRFAETDDGENGKSEAFLHLVQRSWVECIALLLPPVALMRTSAGPNRGGAP